MNVLDSSAWLEYFADTWLAPTFAEPISDLANLIIPTITVFEVHKRASNQRGDEYAEQCVAVMLRGAVLPMTLQVALEASALLRKFDLPMADSVVYATARLSDATTWTCDSDFKDLPNVRYFDKRQK